jgi:formyltetrahydrofolate deformylase
MENYVLKASCRDKPHIISQITASIAQNEGNITDLDQYSDKGTQHFFLRLTFSMDEKNLSSLMFSFKSIREFFDMEISLRVENQKKKMLILCSKQPHCLIHLLEKKRQGAISVDIPAIVSNHKDCEPIAAYHHIPFHHFPISKENKMEQEALIEELIEQNHVDLIVLARYMQILSPTFCKKYEGKIINIHHSFLPGFKGANPYKQAHDRGVKIIGATSHFVTSELDEGPIICQETIRVNHHHSIEEFIRFGADIEALVLARAVKHVLEDKVFIDGNKTVAFK